MIRVLGGVLIVIGLYSVLWGKYKEYKEIEAEQILEPVKQGNQNMGHVIDHHQDIEANNNGAEIQDNQRIMYGVPAVAITAPMPHPPMLALEAPRQ